MEELKEADVLWPETPPPLPSQRDHLPALVVHDTATVLSYEWLREPASSPRPTSTAVLFGRRSSDAPTAAWLDDDVQAEEFQEADVLWPLDEADAAGDQREDIEEFWWLCRDFGEAGSLMEEAEAAAGEREVWRPLRSSPIDIPTRDPTAVSLVHRRRR
ncbi:hypothetical protein E2562_015601 [Oryza meyeriana var. granulata]|uniref:Uncharacterized protein n=1 Tax=Oryza meyeriana var. granulata TaxID=110450 RepID=A0A6G1EJE6_9ORYZ|nr:hypothetical protein E2562_015601 [Oryza meyeriana var. granulata]